MILPVAARELRVASRRRATYWTRTISAGAAFLICFWMLIILWDPTRFGGPTPGATLFRALFWFAFAYVMVAGLRFTASALSRERREGTLGLLFLTDLEGYDVVFGKLAGTAVDALYSTVAILPALGIPLLLGGVTMANFLCASLILLVTLFFSLSVGMLASSFSPDERAATSTAFLILLVFGAVLPVAANVSLFYAGKSTLAGALSLGSPATLALYTFSGPTGGFWLSLLLVHGMSWAFLVLSSDFITRVWRDNPKSGWKLRWQQTTYDFKMGSAPVRREIRRRLLEINPVLWLCSRGRHTRWYVWFFLAAMLAVLIYALAIDKTWSGVATLPLFYITAAFLKYWVASTASHSFAAGKASGNLELIFSTPLEVPDILRGHWMALERQFRKPFLAVVTVEALVVIIGAFKTGGQEPFSWALAHMANMVLLVVDSYTLVWTGLWQAMTRKSPQAATSATVFRVLLIPWFMMAGLMSLCFPILGPTAGMEMIVAWLVIGGVADMMMLANAREKLEGELRAAAAQQFGFGPEKAWNASPATFTE
jgi:hypothetical protein